MKSSITSLDDMKTYFCKEVFPGIFIGDLLAGSSYEVLLRHNITAVLNVSDNVVPEQARGIEYIQVMLDDGPENTKDLFISAVESLIRLRSRHKRILVHCYAGQSRSASIVASYMVKKEQSNLIKICEGLRGANTSPKFMSIDGFDFEIRPKPLASKYDPSLIADPLFLLITSAFKAMSHSRPLVYCNPHLWEAIFHDIKSYLSDSTMSGEEALAA